METRSERAVRPSGTDGAMRPQAAPPARPTTVFSRVTVVAPRTRIDLALPADVAVADLLPMLLEMAGEASPDGGSRHGGWCLAKLGDNAMDPSRTLGSLGVVDGDLLQLRRRSENPPPPLFDDVVDAIAQAAPDSYRPWTEKTARVLGRVAGGLALLAASFALLLAGPGVGAAVSAGLGAIAAVAVGAVIARVYGDTATGILVAAGALPMVFIAGLYVVPGELGRANLLLGSVLMLVFAAALIMVLGVGIITFVAVATAAALGTGTFLVATLVAHPATGIAAGAAAVALGAISVLPRLTLRLARLPLPQVPRNAEDLADDGGFPDYAAIERRTGVAHEYLTGMIIGSGAVAALAAAVGAVTGGMWSWVLGVVVAAVLLLRARNYANGSQAMALLVAGLLATTGLAVGWMLQAAPLELLLLVFGLLLPLAALALVLGVVFPGRRFSPPLRRSVDVTEAILIASVIPLALAAMDLYRTFRQL